MLLASNRIKNIQDIETDLGAMAFVVLHLIIQELEGISLNNKKKVLLIML